MDRSGGGRCHRAVRSVDQTGGVSALSFREPVAVTSWFDWMLTYNTGAAFSFLAEAGGWQRWFLAGVALVVTCSLPYGYFDSLPLIGDWSCRWD